MQTVEHDPDEPPRDRSRSPWPVLIPMVVLLWLGYLTQFTPDWTGICLGLGTGAIIATWAIEVTGNKVPRSWRR